MHEMDFVDEYYADKDLSLLKKLTLVIPTYNRNYYLSRCLWYHAHFPFGEIIVADSSPEEKKVVNRETVQKIREKFGANVRYLEYEPETEKYGGDIYRKWGDAVQHVETEYSQIVTDKEFVIPTTSVECIDYLNRYEDYVTAQGERKIAYLFTFNRCQIKTWGHSCSFDDDSVIDRLKKYNSNRTPDEILLNIHRAKKHKEYYQCYHDSKLNDFRFGEAQLELQPLLAGKAKYFTQMPGKMRDVTRVHNNNSESSSTRYISLSLYPPERKKNLVAILSNCFQNNLNTQSHTTDNPRNSDEILEIVLEIIKWWFCADIYPQKSNKDIFRKYPCLGKIWMAIPTKLQLYLSVMLANEIVLRKNNIFNRDNEIKIISKMINETKQMYKEDMKIC
ncbi:hypothetical protein McpCs1_12360 [Methanocorpusculaceae archaeon Cs1]|uniref:Uncharacterized protein n=2 Tax=Methanorbis rubei TaxID=3028300 RepID=A0AAE4SCJ5_9EURY|nr:hypothetical protein [Methanocorpusculaceae archaeon Cs1]